MTRHPAPPRRRPLRPPLPAALLAAAILVWSLIWTLAATPAPARAAEPAAPDIPARLHAFLEDTGTPGVALAVLRDDPKAGDAEPQVWTAGLASVELNAPVTPQTVFCIGSLTKVFTAALVMELVQEDKLGLDDLLGRRLSGITDPKVQAITLRQLLEHASGLADFLSSKTFQKNMAVPYAPRPLLDMALKLPMSFAPGSRFGYSNTNYLVLGLVLEQATGTPYAELLQRRAVTPLGLVDTRLGDDRSIFPGRAQGYRRNGEPGDDAATQELAPPILASLVPPWASGGLISRPGEFVKLARLGHLLRPAALDAMRRDDPAITEGRLGFPLTPDGPYFELDYSPGFEVVRLDHADTPMLCKSGSFPGFASWFVWLPERGLALAASCNNETAIMDLFGLLAGVARDL